MLQESKSTWRNTGLVWSVAFFLIALQRNHTHQNGTLVLLVLSIILLGVSIFIPFLLRVPSRYWYWLGDKLHSVMSPVVMGILYFFLFTPIALLLRLRKEKSLQLDWNQKQDSYWEMKKEGPQSLRKQF